MAVKGPVKRYTTEEVGGMSYCSRKLGGGKNVKGAIGISFFPEEISNTPRIGKNPHPGWFPVLLYYALPKVSRAFNLRGTQGFPPPLPARKFHVSLPYRFARFRKLRTPS